MSETKDQYEQRLRKNHEEMVKTKVTRLTYEKFRERQHHVNEAAQKRAYEERNGR